MKVRTLMLIVATSPVPLLAYAEDQAGSEKAYSDAAQKMMQSMQMLPTGDPDKDFVMMMRPHHQGAIDMAKVELKYGKDPELRKMASDIVSAQEKEIAEMKQWEKKQKQ